MNETSTKDIKVYGAINKSDDVRLKSSSGGIFTAIASEVLRQGGVVFGAAFDSDFKVKHTCVESLEDLTCLQQSKYVQSDVGDSYKKTEDLLKTGRLVLYSGTSCQIFGLKNYLRKEYGNLLTLDLICHGAPLDWVWELYLKFLKTKYNCEIEEVSFRDKTFGWRNFALCVKFKNGETIKEEFKNNLYMQVFLKNLSLKSSCYNCYFKGFNRVSDFTLGDAWGIEKFCPAIDDGLGVSLIYVNSAKGKEIFDSLSSLDKVKVDNIEAIKTNLMMVSSVREPKNRKKFLNKVNETNFEKISNKYLRQGLVERTLKKVKRIIRK